jgi:hypothetical protein
MHSHTNRHWLPPIVTAASTVMAGSDPPFTPLFGQAKGVNADLRRDDEAARPESQRRRRLVSHL